MQSRNIFCLRNWCSHNTLIKCKHSRENLGRAIPYIYLAWASRVCTCKPELCCKYFRCYAQWHKQCILQSLYKQKSWNNLRGHFWTFDSSVCRRSSIHWHPSSQSKLIFSSLKIHFVNGQTRTKSLLSFSL